MSENLVLDEARRIALKLVDAFEGNALGGGWMVPHLVREGSVDRAITVEAGIDIYQGRAGIGLFIHEAQRSGLVESAGSIPARVLSEILQYPDHRWHSGGLFLGLPGSAYVGACIGNDLQHEELLRLSVASAKKAIDYHTKDPCSDVLSGAAGIIFAALGFYDLVRDEAFLHFASDQAEKIVKRAICAGGGFSWPGVSPSVSRNPVGFSHGTAGIGAALARAGDRLDRSDWVEIAIGAFQYEDCTNGAARRSMPEYRYFDIDLARLAVDLDYRAVVLEKIGGSRRIGSTVGSTWCNGEPGALLARALCAVSYPESRDIESRLAHQVELSLHVRTGSDSICHGFLGNALCLLHWARVRGMSTVADRVRNLVSQRFLLRREGWVSGAWGKADDPSLMLGQAGVGLALMSTFLEHVRSPLLAGLPLLPHAKAAQGSGARSPSLRLSLGRMFPLVHALCPTVQCDGLNTRQRDQVVRKCLRNDEQKFSRRSVGRFVRRSARLILAASHRMPNELFRSIVMLELEESCQIDWDTQIATVPWVSIVPGKLLWSDSPPPMRRWYLLTTDCQPPSLRPCSNLAAFVLRSARRVATVKGIVALAVAEFGATSLEDEERVGKAVRDQIRSCRSGGLVRVHNPKSESLI